jgi:PTH1 family peptidyl-tRNA hydrolase
LDPFIVVGLGNPGSEFDGTRHNVGFIVIDELCRRLGKSLKGGRGNYSYATARAGETELVIVKPLTYMNNSGLAVLEVLENMRAALQNIVVVADDFALPLGTLRIRPRGSDGGHNGLRSIIYHLNSGEFARIRCGIGRSEMPPKHLLSEFVLSAFDRDELRAAKEMTLCAADAVMELATWGIARAMNKFNG